MRDLVLALMALLMVGWLTAVAITFELSARAAAP